MKPLFSGRHTPLEAEDGYFRFTHQRKLMKLYPKKRYPAYAEFAALLVQLQAAGGSDDVTSFISSCASAAVRGNTWTSSEHMLARLMEDTFISINCPDVHKLFPPELRASALIAEYCRLRNPAPVTPPDVCSEIAELRLMHERRKARRKLLKAERAQAVRKFLGKDNAR